MAHFDAEVEPPLDAVLVEPEVVLELELPVESELDAPALLVLLVLEPVADPVPVVADEPVVGGTVCTHGFVVVVVVLGDAVVGVVDGAEDVEALLVGGVPALLVEDPSVAVPESGAVGAAQAEAVLVPLTPLATELSVLEESVMAEAPVDGDRPAPPAVGRLWWCLGLAGTVAGASALASAGAVETVASTTRAMAWMPVA